jgi:hypothetical protein
MNEPFGFLQATVHPRTGPRRSRSNGFQPPPFPGGVFCFFGSPYSKISQKPTQPPLGKVSLFEIMIINPNVPGFSTLSCFILKHVFSKGHRSNHGPTGH